MSLINLSSEHIYCSITVAIYSLDSSRDLQSICVMRFIFLLHLVHHANDLQKFCILKSKHGLIGVLSAVTCLLTSRSGRHHVRPSVTVNIWRPCSQNPWRARDQQPASQHDRYLPAAFQFDPTTGCSRSGPDLDRRARARAGPLAVDPQATRRLAAWSLSPSP